ncbi:hypothetical protein L6452_21881 [Arctium lappa]|uniref:Uncharacterized protein n=1 Tax=Arctium lappa TaxID=4217 RepID=A0ACB9AXV7_ARCLA|nr:hypothetical protein L6452_21881 [Arctium lappa]
MEKLSFESGSSRIETSHMTCFSESFEGAINLTKKIVSIVTKAPPLRRRSSTPPPTSIPSSSDQVLFSFTAVTDRRFVRFTYLVGCSGYRAFCLPLCPNILLTPKPFVSYYDPNQPRKGMMSSWKLSNRRLSLTYSPTLAALQ